MGQMPAIAFSDLGKPANLLSLARIPLGIAFPFVPSMEARVAILVVGGLTDVLDGWVARRRGEATALGAVIDPIADKVFAGAIVVTLVLSHLLTTWGIFALLAREVLEAPLVVWVLAHAPARRARWVESKANASGKIATAVQFTAVLAALAWRRFLDPLLVATAVTGVWAGVSYWRREVRSTKSRLGAPG